VNAPFALFGPLPVRRHKRDWRRLVEIRRFEQALLVALGSAR
jgi:hypothetical protein